MSRLSVVLIALLIASNAVWFWTTYGGEASLDDDVARLEAALEMERRDRAALERQLGERIAEAELEARGTAAPAPKRNPPRRGPDPEAVKRREEAMRQAQARKAAKDEVEAIQAQVLQVHDAAKRETALRDLAGILRSDDPIRVSEALRSLNKLSKVDYDRQAFRDLVLHHLAGDDAWVRRSAAYALYNVQREPGDLDLIIEAMEADPDKAYLFAHLLLMFNGNKADGVVAERIAKLLDTDDMRKGREVANSLRGIPSTLEVQEGVVALWRKHQATGQTRGLWFHILGQMKPQRAPVMRAVYEALAGPEADREGGLLTARLHIDVEKEDQPLALELATDLLKKSPNSHIRRAMYDVFAMFGTITERRLLDDYMTNDLLPERERKKAAEVARRMDRRLR